MKTKPTKRTASKGTAQKTTSTTPATEPHAATIEKIQRLLAPIFIDATNPDGDPRAGAALVSLAADLCAEVSAFACTHQTAADELARARMNWPILCDIHPEMRARNLRWLDVLPIGESSGWRPIGRKSYSLTTPAARAILSAVKVTGVCNFTSVLKYYEAKGSLETQLKLRPIGLSFAEGKRDTCPRGSRSYESNVCAGIRDRLRKAFRALFIVPEK